MIMIITALYCEAKPLIEYYHLKKSKSTNKFQVYTNAEIMLVVTNVGSIAAVSAVSHLCTLYPPNRSSYLINIGICGATDESIPVGSIFLCNKIIEEGSNRSFYPDVILRHPFAEADITTWHTVVRDSSHSNMENHNRSSKLFDMESAGIYQAATYYYQPHQVSFIKIVSDYGVQGKLEPEGVTRLVMENIKSITEWIGLLDKTRLLDNPIFSEEEEQLIRNTAESLKCSVTMEAQLRQQLCYYKLVNGSFAKIINEFCIQNTLPCKSKKEGKIYLEQLRAKLI